MRSSTTGSNQPPCVLSTEDGIIEKMVNGSQKASVIINKDKEHEGNYQSAVEDDDSLVPAGANKGGDKAGYEVPDNGRKNCNVCYEETKCNYI